MYFNYYNCPEDCPFNGFRSEFPPPPPYDGGTHHGGTPSGPPPQGGMQHQGVPSGPPPSLSPNKAQAQLKATPKAIESGAIRPCKYQYIYIWLENGQHFWAWLTFVGRRSVSGYRWTGHRWVYFGTDLRRIESFICY